MTEIVQTPNPTCSSCKIFFKPNLKSSGLPYKSCGKCISRNKVTNSKRCPHNKFKYQCRECNGTSFCGHSTRRHDCKVCVQDDVEKVLKIIIKTFINCSYVADKKYNRLNIQEFIDTDFCRLLIEESNYQCCYCKCSLELIHHTNNLISIERIDNKIGHNKNNVKICCLHCNISKVGNKEINLEVN